MTLTKRPEYPSMQSLGISESDIFEYGNINLNTRPIVKLKNGQIATIFSITINDKISLGDEQFVHNPNHIRRLTPCFTVIPTVSDDGVIVTTKEASLTYAISGRHLGKFATIKIAEKYAKALSRQEDKRYRTQIKNNPDYLIGDKTWYPIEQIIEPSNRNLGGILQITDLYGATAEDFKNNLITVGVNYGMDLNPEISIEIIDEDYKMFDSNYFVIRRDITYRGRRYEIAEVSTKPGPGGSPSVVVKARNKALQQMRRDKLPNSVAGSSGYEYAGNAAKKFGLQFVGQQSAKTKSTFKARTGDGEESVWDVLTRTASDNQFVVFEVDGVLVYASQEWLLYKFGSSYMIESGQIVKKFVPLLFYPNRNIKELIDEMLLGNHTELFQLETWHDFSSSDNEPMAATGSCNVLMPQGGALRPGHTAICGPFPQYFFGAYLITDVSFNEGSPDPAQISFRTPEEPKDQKDKPIKPKVGSKPGNF